MKEILKNIELNQMIGLYHFEDSCFTVGKIFIEIRLYKKS